MNLQYKAIVIDDEPAARRLMKNLLQEYAETVSVIAEAGHGREAMQKIEELNPDLIFLDINMPRMDGRQCLIHLRKMPRLDRVPIIIFTTLKPGYEGEEYRQLGANLCVTKPMLYAELKKVIRSIITTEWTTGKLRVNK